MLLFLEIRTKDKFILISNLMKFLDPPSPFQVETPVPSPSYGKDDFDPTYEGSDLLPDFSSESDASMYNLSTPDERVLFPFGTL